MKITSLFFALFGFLGLPVLLGQHIQIEELKTHRSYHFQVRSQEQKSVYTYPQLGHPEDWQYKTYIMDLRIEVYPKGQDRRKLEVYLSRVQVQWASDHKSTIRLEDSYYPPNIGSPISTLIHLADKHFEFDWYLGQNGSLPQLERYRGSMEELQESFAQLQKPEQRAALEGHLVGFEKMIQHLTTGAESAFFPQLSCVATRSEREAVEIEGQWLGSPPAELWIKGAIYPTIADELDERLELRENGTFVWQNDFEKSQSVFIAYKLTPESILTYARFHLSPGDKLRLEAQTVEGKVRWNIAGKGGGTNRFLQGFYEKFREGKVNTFLLYPGPISTPLNKAAPSYELEKEELAYLESVKGEMPVSVFKRFKAEIIYGYAYKKLEAQLDQVESYRWLLVEEKLSPKLLALDLEIQELPHYPSYGLFVAKFFQGVYQQTFEAKLPHWRTEIPSVDAAPFFLSGSALYVLQAQFLESMIKQYRFYTQTDYQPSQAAILDRLDRFTEICKDPFLNDELKELGGYMSRLKVGNRAPDFCLPSLAQDEYCLHHSRGHNTLLVFYRELNEGEVTSFVRIEEEFPDVHFLYICVDEDEKLWRKKAQEWDMGGTHLYAPGLFVGPSSEYLITGLRRSLVMVDERGRIAESFGVKNSHDDLRIILQRAQLKQQQRAEARRRYEEANGLDWFSIMVIGLFNLGFMVGLGWLILRWRARRIRRIEARKNEKLELTLRSIRAQMNPHFLFNSLSSIQHLVNSQDNEKANHYLTRFSQLVRKVLQYSEVPLISLQEELDLIRTYAELESLRTPFTLEIEVDPLVDPYTTELPGLLLQPYVENAIRHGLAPLKDRQGRIDLTIAKVGYELWITLEDNGIGLEKAKEQKVAVESGGGFGIRLNKERLEALENQWGSPIDVVVEDRKYAFPAAQGTRVEIRLPLEN